MSKLSHCILCVFMTVVTFLLIVIHIWRIVTRLGELSPTNKISYIVFQTAALGWAVYFVVCAWKDYKKLDED